MKNEYKEFAEQLSELLAPLAEVGIYSSEGQELQVWNRLFPAEKSITDAPKEVHLAQSSDGRSYKQSILPLPSTDKSPAPLLRVRLDVGSINTAVEQLQQLIALPAHESRQAPSWQQRVDLAIQHFLDERHLTLPGATRTDKRELVATLQRAGYMRYKQASQYLAQTLGLSRATIYNYLKAASSAQAIQVHQVDTFTDRKFAGNPAGVVLDADELTEPLMQQVTREMNLSETAFVLRSSQADLRLRYFTPSGDEMKFCGHSTVGALYMLGHERRCGISRPGRYSFQVETGAGILKMDIAIDADETMTIAYEAPPIDLQAAEVSSEEFAKIMGIPANTLDQRYPVMWEATNQTLFAMMPSLDALGTIQPDLRSMENHGKREKIVAYCLATTGTFNEESSLHCRCFAPAVGISEDPFTGSIQGGLAAYAATNELIKNDKKQILVEQGHFAGRPGSVAIQLKKEKNSVSATIQARAVHCFSTQIQIH